MSHGDVKDVNVVKLEPITITANKKKGDSLAEGNKPRRNATEIAPPGVFYPGQPVCIAPADKTAVFYTNDMCIQPERSNIATIDDFKEVKEFDIDGDGVNDFTHGEIVEKYIHATNPYADVSRFQVEFNADGSIKPESFAKQMNAVSDSLKAGVVYDAVNVSLGDDICLANNCAAAKVGITPENIHDKENNLRSDALYNTNAGADPLYQKVKGYIQSTEKVTAEGVPVHVAGGNDNKDSYNLLGIAKGTIQIGAVDRNGNKVHTVNSDIERYEQGRFETATIYDDDFNIVGFDINEDGTADIMANEVSGKGAYGDDYSIIIDGSSFSTPIDVAKTTDKNYFNFFTR